MEGKDVFDTDGLRLEIPDDLAEEGWEVAFSVDRIAKDSHTSSQALRESSQRMQGLTIFSQKVVVRLVRYASSRNKHLRSERARRS